MPNSTSPNKQPSAGKAVQLRRVTRALFPHLKDLSAAIPGGCPGKRPQHRRVKAVKPQLYTLFSTQVYGRPHLKKGHWEKLLLKGLCSNLPYSSGTCIPKSPRLFNFSKVSTGIFPSWSIFRESTEKNKYLN